jgi:GNAT superfamily N-acetyltransferase
VRIETVDPRDDAAFDAWFAVTAEVELHDRPGEPHGQAEEQRAFALASLGPQPEMLVTSLVAVEGDRAVGAARLELPVDDNHHLAEVLVAVRPDSRRRGVGSALLAELERLAKEQGRTTVLTTVDEPPLAAGPAPGRAFAERHGYTNVQTEVRRDIDLPLDPARVQALEARCAPFAEGYAVGTWRDRTPDDVVDDMAHLMRRMSVDTPLGGTDYREEEWDAGRVRRREQLVAAQNRTFFAGGAVHEQTGRLVAFTVVGVPLGAPGRAYQWETLVLSEHRGRRLGTLVKLACLQAIAEGLPTTRFVSTWNAEENAPMITVNDALGARTNGVLGLWQRTVG